MREFKFRAWAQPLKKMDYSSLNAITFDGRVYFGNADITGFHNVVMQYTGEKDRKGVDVYEGDIVEFEDRPYVFHKYEIIYSFGSYCGIRRENGDTKTVAIYHMSMFGEVIGNIYENKEILV